MIDSESIRLAALNNEASGTTTNSFQPSLQLAGKRWVRAM
jgi:hypothetical protein